MAQQHTTPAAGSAYKKPALFLLYPILFVEAVQAMDSLQRQANSEWKRCNWRDTSKSKALMLGVYAINDRAEDYARQARAGGSLLLCWSGSKVVQLREQVFA